MEFSTIAANMYHTLLSSLTFAMIAKCYITQYISAYKALIACDILNLIDELMKSVI